MTFDVDAIRKQFPILGRAVHGKPLVYFDNAASAQKPDSVIDAMVIRRRLRAFTVTLIDDVKDVMT